MKLDHIGDECEAITLDIGDNPGLAQLIEEKKYQGVKGDFGHVFIHGVNFSSFLAIWLEIRQTFLTLVKFLGLVNPRNKYMQIKLDFKFDSVLAVTVAGLLVFGLIMITSIGVPKSIELSAQGIAYPSCADDVVDCYLLFKKHFSRMLVGLLAFYVAFKLPIKLWRKISPLMFGATAVILLLVFFVGQDHGTIATSWVTLFNTSIQPSEFAKLSMIIYLAYWFTKKGASISSFEDGFIPFAVISGMMILPVILQNDYGSTVVLAMIAVAMYFVAGAKIKHMALGFAIALVSSIIIIASVDHVRDRFSAFVNIDESCIQDDCWQSRQANIAVGSGGFFGKGLTQGVQKNLWLPQASDDFIFAASAEELGFIRIVLVVLAYFIIAVRGYQIAQDAQSSFEMLMATGITTWIVVQAFINIAVNTALFPVTGITLPFVSYGGSSLVSCLIAIGILLHISERNPYDSRSINRRRHRRPRSAKLRRYRRA